MITVSRIKIPWVLLRVRCDLWGAISSPAANHKSVFKTMPKPYASIVFRPSVFSLAIISEESAVEISRKEITGSKTKSEEILLVQVLSNIFRNLDNGVDCVGALVRQR